MPVVFNCGGYESVETLRLLEGKVQIWLPDLKYGLEEPARRYSPRPGLLSRACGGHTGDVPSGGSLPHGGWPAAAGVVMRHLVLPDSWKHPAGHRLGPDLPSGRCCSLLMSQYTPQPGAEGPLRRHVTGAEYRAAAEYMENCGIVDGFVQERTSAREEYTPAFDLTGV